MTSPTRKILGVAGGVGAVATGAAATALTIVTRQRKSGRDPHDDEPLGQLEPDHVCTVAADDGVPLHVEEVDPPDGGPASLTLIGVHELGMTRQSWHFQRRDLVALTLPRVRQVYYDHRGHGQSGAVTDETSTIEQLAADLHAVIRAMAPDGRIVLVGHGIGGMAIIALAETEPELFADRVCGVSLIATSAGGVAASKTFRALLSKYSPVGWSVGGIGELADWQPEIVELVRSAGGRLTRAAGRRLLFGGTAGSSVMDFVLGMLEVMPVTDLFKFVGTLGEHDRFAALSALKDAEVQVIGGSADALLPFSHSERIADELPQARVVQLRNVGHVPQLEQPDVVTSQLIDLLQTCCDVERGVGVRDETFRRMLKRWF